MLINSSNKFRVFQTTLCSTTSRNDRGETNPTTTRSPLSPLAGKHLLSPDLATDQDVGVGLARGETDLADRVTGEIKVISDLSRL